jgi:hypothetical protein
VLAISALDGLTKVQTLLLFACIRAQNGVVTDLKPLPVPAYMDVLPGMNAGVSIFATPSPIEGSRVAEEDVGRLGIEPGAPNAYPSPP